MFIRSGPEVIRRVLSAIFGCFLVATVTRLDAQIGGAGAIQGVVSDPSGAAVPGATVAATNVATAVNTTRETTKTGYYVISPLPAGEYSVTVTAAGFERTVQERVTVDALAQVGLNLTLQIGGATQQVTVTGAPPALNTSDASMGQTMRNEIYGSLPLQMGNAPRDPTAFTQLLPVYRPAALQAIRPVMFWAVRSTRPRSTSRACPLQTQALQVRVELSGSASRSKPLISFNSKPPAPPSCIKDKALPTMC